MLVVFGARLRSLAAEQPDALRSGRRKPTREQHEPAPSVRAPLRFFLASKARAPQKPDGANASEDEQISGRYPVSVEGLQAALTTTLPRIIAVNWEPQGGTNQLDAAVTNVLARLKPQASAPAPLRRASIKVSPAVIGQVPATRSTDLSLSPVKSISTAGVPTADGFTNRITQLKPEQGSG